MIDNVAVNEDFKKKYIDKNIKVTTKNGRKFSGVFKAIDFRGNLVIHNGIGQIPADQNCPLNYQLNTPCDGRLIYINDPNLTEQQNLRKKTEYFGTHFYIGPLVISGNDFSKIEVQIQKKTV